MFVGHALNSGGVVSIGVSSQLGENPYWTMTFYLGCGHTLKKKKKTSKLLHPI